MSNQGRVTGGDFLRMGVLLATLRALLGLPRATMVWGDCPQCGSHVPMLKVRGKDGGPSMMTCTNCPYRVEFGES